MLAIGQYLAKIGRQAMFSSGMITRSQVAAFSSENISVIHDQNKNKFVVTIGNDKAVLEYSQDKTAINVLHVYVPDVFRGKGVAQKLSQAALQYIASNNLKMIMTCTYFKHYVETVAPEYKKYLL